jgi:hypothetical protein
VTPPVLLLLRLSCQPTSAASAVVVVSIQGRLLPLLPLLLLLAASASKALMPAAPEPWRLRLGYEFRT